MFIKPIILCGGSGTRLWPESRKKFPKQFVKLFGEKSLFDLTLNRLKKIKNVIDFTVITNEEYRFYVRESLSKYSIDGKCILEPEGKNTTAAIYIAAKFSKKNEDLLILPSDHFIQRENNFINTINNAHNRSNKNNWVIFGAKPNFPSTGYGYIKLKKNNSQNNLNFNVEKFEEKPNIKKAQYFFENKFLWNAGIFMATREVIVNSIKKFEPEIANKCDDVFKNQIQKKNSNDISFNKSLFNKIPAISIDYAIMEKVNNITCYPLNCGWNDVGSWDSLSNLNVSNSKNNIIQVSSQNNFIRTDKRIIATIGIKDLLIIDTNDATLIAKKGQSENVKKIVNSLKTKNIKEAFENNFELRPWGKFENLSETKECKVKKITVFPYQRLSKQFHKYRSEHWMIIKGTGTVYLNDKKIILKKGNSIDIKKKSIHYIENNTEKNLIFIEIQMGTYFGEDDIFRLDDPYERS